MAPDCTMNCPCGKAVVIISKGAGVCSFCGRRYVLEAQWTPPPPKAKEARA